MSLANPKLTEAAVLDEQGTVHRQTRIELHDGRVEWTLPTGAFYTILGDSPVSQAGSGEAGQPHAVLRPCVVLTGADSHVSERSYHRITSATEWVARWRKHKGKKPDDAPAGLPLVDFDRFMVIAIFQGRAVNSAGLKAVSITVNEDRIVFRFDDDSYQTAGEGKDVTVYGFFVVLRSNKPLVLEEDVQGIIGEPPVWKERSVLPKT